MNPRVSFGELPIGARFHNGKHFGMGARSHVQNWQEIEKVSDKGAAVVVVAHGDLYHAGYRLNFHRMARVFPLCASRCVLTDADRRAFASVESPAVSPTQDR